MPAVFEQRMLVMASSKRQAIKLGADGMGEFMGKPVFSHSLSKKNWSAMRMK